MPGGGGEARRLWQDTPSGPSMMVRRERPRVLSAVYRGTTGSMSFLLIVQILSQSCSRVRDHFLGTTAVKRLGYMHIILLRVITNTSDYFLQTSERIARWISAGVSCIQNTESKIQCVFCPFEESKQHDYIEREHLDERMFVAIVQ